MLRGSSTMFRIRLLSGVAIACLMPVAAGHAQTAPQSAAADDSGGLEEVIVSTEKQQKDIQKTSESVSAIDSDRLDKANITEVSELSGLVPGLTIAKNEGYNRVVSIRGIGFETPQNDSAQTSVSYHVDGVYIAAPVALNGTFLDVSQIEVARGPQGTVFGQNSTGGTINVISNQPKLNEFSGDESLSYGSYNLVRSSGVLNVPIDDTLAVRMAYTQTRHDGYAIATQVPGYPGGFEEDNEDDVAARVLVLWKPISALSVTFGANYFDADDNARAEKSILDPNPDPRQLTQDFPGRFGMRNEDYDIIVSYDLDWATVKNITSYQYLKQRQVVDNDRLDFDLEPFSHDIVPDTHRAIRTITEEVNLSSPVGQPLEWIVGSFFLDTRTNVGFLEYTYDGANNCVKTLNCPSDYNPANVGLLGNGFESIATPARTSWSFYGQGTYHWLDDLSFTGGARYTHDELSSDPQNYFAPPTYLNASANAVTGRASVNYDITPRNLVYFTWSTGFKPGASNLESASNPPLVVPFVAKPESIEAWEVGSKNDFFDKHLRANFSAFYYDYTNFQFAAEDPKFFVGGVDNIPKSEVYGLEGEITALLPYNFRLDLNGALEHGRVDSHFKALDPVVGNAIIAEYGYTYNEATILARQAAEQDVYGHSLPKLPHLAITGVLSQTLDLGEYGTLVSSGEMRFRTRYNYRIFDNSGTDEVPVSVLFDLAFEYDPPSSHWSFDFDIENLCDRTLINSKYTDSFGIGATSYEYEAPRLFIAKAEYKF